MNNKSLPQLINKCQIVFNEYIRLRDLAGCSHFKCISCGEIKDEKYMHAGHFYSSGHYSGLRFDEDNCNGQCNHCNTFLHGNLIDYGFNLLIKIGPERFEKLKLKAGVYKRTGYKFTRYELIEKIDYFKKKIKELENNF
jgi:hypothetical protein